VWLWGSIRVALVPPLRSHWGGFGVAIGCLSTRFGVALRSHWVALRRLSPPFLLSVFYFLLLTECRIGVA
jgi:hypothetical protein